MLLAAGGVAVLVSAGYLHHVLGTVEDWSMDKRFAIRGAHVPKDVAIVAVDARTLSALGPWPFPRRDHGTVIGRISAAHPRAIAVDIQFTEPTDPADDNALIAAIESSGKVALATTETDRAGRTDVLGGDEVVRQVGARVGDSLVPVDANGVIRRIGWGSATRDDEGRPLRPLENLSLVAAEVATGRPIRRFGALTPIAYVGPPGTIPMYSYADVMRGRVPGGAFTGKVVVLGPAAPSLHDVHTTPYGGSDQMSGVEIQANATETALHGFPLRPSRTRALLLIVLFAFLVPVASLFLRWRWCLLGGAVAAVLYLVAAQLSFDHGVLLAVMWPLLALLLGTLVAAFLRPPRPLRNPYA